MSETKNSTPKNSSLEWLVRGVLTKIGDTFDRFTGRRWTPSSSLATSELIEKLKKLLDAEVKDFGIRGRFVPHNVKLKMQWDKFSTDSEDAIRRLENELKIAAIDHINDQRYHTYAPLKLEITPDYFTEGVQLLVSYEKFDTEKGEVAVNVTVPQIKVGDYLPEPPPAPEPVVEEAETYIARFALAGRPQQLTLKFAPKERRSVGRSKENDLSLEDPSVSKMHAALVLSAERRLMVADTGSTNGTFIDDKRIAYGRAFPVTADGRVKFGNIEVRFEHVPRPAAPVAEPDAASLATEQIHQRDLPTVAFQAEPAAPPTPAPTVLPAPAPRPAAPETRFMDIKPVTGTVPKEADEAASPVTEDRIKLDFSNREE